MLSACIQPTHSSTAADTKPAWPLLTRCRDRTQRPADRGDKSVTKLSHGELRSTCVSFAAGLQAGGRASECSTASYGVANMHCPAARQQVGATTSGRSSAHCMHGPLHRPAVKRSGCQHRSPSPKFDAKIFQSACCPRNHVICCAASSQVGPWVQTVTRTVRRQLSNMVFVHAVLVRRGRLRCGCSRGRSRRL